MSKTIEEIFTPKPEARPPRIYAYSIDDKAHEGLLKIGQTTRNVKQRVAEQLKTAAIKNYKIELDETAGRNDGTIFSDHDVRAALVRKKFENIELEWMRCSLQDVKTVLNELRTRKRFTGTHDQTFPMRREQAEAVKTTALLARVPFGIAPSSNRSHRIRPSLRPRNTDIENWRPETGARNWPVAPENPENYASETT